MAEIRAAVAATFDTIEVMRGGLAKRGGQTERRPHNVIEIQDAVISACQREQDRQVRDVLAAVREATVGLSLLPIRLRLSHEFCLMGRLHLSQVTDALVGLCLRLMLEPRPL